MLNMESLNRVTEDFGNEMEAALAEHRRRYPVDPAGTFLTRTRMSSG